MWKEGLGVGGCLRGGHFWWSRIRGVGACGLGARIGLLKSIWGLKAISRWGEFTDYGICNVCTSLVADTKVTGVMDLTSKFCEANFTPATIHVLGPDKTTMPDRGYCHLSSSWTINFHSTIILFTQFSAPMELPKPCDTVYQSTRTPRSLLILLYWSVLPDTTASAKSA